jgi:multicomponent Na+:H+ antiporter subunit F
MTATMIVAGSMFALGAVLATLRLLRGPALIDRAAALDVLLTTVVGVLVLIAAESRSAVALTIGVVVALLGFLASASLATLLPRNRR